MRIENDIVTFDAADFDRLSEFGKRAVVSYLEDYAAYFSAKVNKEIELAKAHLKTLTVADPRTDAIVAGLAAADEATRLQAEPLLNQLDVLLNPDSEAAEPEAAAPEVVEPEAAALEVAAPEVTSTEAEPLSFLEKVKSFFS